jgi:hypothetical protein
MNINGQQELQCAMSVSMINKSYKFVVGRQLTRIAIHNEHIDDQE